MADLPGEKRPRFTPGDGRVGAEVRAVGNATGLERMGVWHRTIAPGMAGTHRHYHLVEEEWAFVLEGTGLVRIGPHTIPVRSGSFAAFPPGPRPHHFVNTGSEPLVILEGGERRPEEDIGRYVDLAKGWERGRFFEPDGPPPPEQGDASQVVHVDDVTPERFVHDVDSEARRRMRSLHRAAGGLQHQAVRWTRVAAGEKSTAYHTHERTDEWIYVLEGRASVRVGDARFEVCAGDFLGHPAGSPPHQMRPETDLVYLMGGMVDADDVVLYPEAGQRRVAGRLEPWSDA